MPPINQETVQGFVNAGMAGTTAQQGKALEDLACYVFGLVPGIAITRRNALNVFDTEEIDVALWNDGAANGLFFLPNLLLVECKNWSARVGSAEVSWFDAKLRSRGLEYGLLISPLGITGHAQDLTAAHSVVAGALRERRRLLIVTTAELLALAHTDDLVLLIKEKLCDLALSGTAA